MKGLMLVLLAMAGMTAAAQADVPPPGFDAALAAELGADDYGMRRYVVAFLKAGPNRDHGPDAIAALQRGHMEHMRRMADDGKLIMAGPFLDGGELRGIFVFAVETLEEAAALTAADPAVEAGRLAMELHPWYGSAALLKVGEIHKAIARTNP